MPSFVKQEAHTTELYLRCCIRLEVAPQYFTCPFPLVASIKSEFAVQKAVVIVVVVPHHPKLENLQVEL